MSQISQRLANRRSEPLQKLIVFQIRQERFAVLIQFAKKVIPLGLVYGAPQGGISLTRYQDYEIPVIDVERRVFSKAVNLSLMSASPKVNDSSDASEKLYPQPVLDNQRHLMIVEDIQGSLIGLPMDSPPTLRRVPKSAFSPIPAIYLAEGNIQCVSALITVSESEPPFFLLNLDQVLQQGSLEPRYSPESASRDLPGMAMKDLPEGASRDLQESFETRHPQP
jgi:chemotaxis signal transduction protein